VPGRLDVNIKKKVDVSKEINDMRKVLANNKSFECGEIEKHS